jgi:hypothetical protein
LCHPWLPVGSRGYVRKHEWKNAAAGFAFPIIVPKAGYKILFSCGIKFGMISIRGRKWEKEITV